MCCATGKPPLPHALRRRGEKGASPTWHRQARRARAVHRRVCRRFEAGEHILRPRLEAAVASLSSHHGSRPPKAALEALCPCGEDSFSAGSLATMAWVCGACGQSNWIHKWLCRGCRSHQALWTTMPKPPAIVAKDRQSYAQAAARGASVGKGGKGKGKMQVQAAHPPAVPRPPAPPLTPTEDVAPLVRGSKSWKKAKTLELQCKESMLANAMVFDARSVGFLQQQVEGIRLELREAQPIHRRIAGVTDALTKSRKRHILAASALAEAVAAERAAGEKSLELEAELRRLHSLQAQAPPSFCKWQ